MRIYDPRLGRFLSVDPLTDNYSYYSPYQYAGNTPIKFIDLDGAETYDNSSKYWSGQPLINMANAPVKGRNAAGVPRNAIWFFKQQLKAKPEMFSETNKLRISLNRNPIVDEQWVKFNPAASDYLNVRLIHHHIDGKELTAAIPERMHFDYFSDLHPYLKAAKSPRGSKFSGLLGGTLNFLGNASFITGLFTGDPDNWINSFGYGEPNVGDIKKDWESGVYIQIIAIQNHFIPVLDKDGNPVLDEKTGQQKYRLGSKTITANIYSGYIWDEDDKQFKGVNKIDAKVEEWQYDEKGKRIQEDKSFNVGNIES